MLPLKRSVTADYVSTKRQRINRKRFKGPSGFNKMSAIGAMVKKEIAKSRETKFIFSQMNEISLTTGAPSPPVLSFPNVPQGTASNQRIGNKITPTGAGFRFVYWNQSSQVLAVRRLFIQVYNDATNSEIQANLFEGSTAQDTGMPTGISRLIRKPNREDFRVLKDDVFTIGYEAAGYASATPRFQIDKGFVKLHGDFTYADTDLQDPRNGRLAVILILQAGNGDPSGMESIEYSYELDMYYKD